MSFLGKIAAARFQRVNEARQRTPLEALQDRCAGTAPPRDAVQTLAAWPLDRRAIIAEVKRKSPSRGPLRPDLDPASLAQTYERAGAFAISVLTEPDYFGGSLADLDSVRGAVGVPVLYKDFVIDPYQIWEARSCGADLVLLIAGLLEERLGDYLRLAVEIGLAALVEVHDEPELRLALRAGARLVGINNRNLKTFSVDLAVSRELLPLIPAGVLAVSESGIRERADVEELFQRGARAFLVGETLVRSADPGGALRALARGAG